MTTNNDQPIAAPTSSGSHQDQTPAPIVETTIHRYRKTLHTLLRALTTFTRTNLTRAGKRVRNLAHRSGLANASRMSGAILASLIASALFLLLTELLHHLTGSP